ncbi:MAG TPA: hypothetical protein VM869_19380 [Enhygromyxa sp.]|jgi:hypothetical protein|nr:hypothetical protein [Enhygromyxa sp.]
MPEVYTCLKLRGPYRPHPTTRVEWPTEVTVREVCDAASDARKYVVAERLIGTRFTELRSQEFVCASYLGDERNGCGHDEHRAAMQLARDWAAE